MSFAEDIVPNNATSAVITGKESGLVLTGLEIDPRELYFGAMVIGEDPMTKTATVKNIGRRTLRINSVVLETESNQFQMVEAHPNLLKSGESFTVTATYAGDQPTLVTGVIYITTNEDRDPYRIMLSGRVLASLYIQEQFDDFNARLEQESWARADGDGAEAGQRLLLQASLRDETDAKILVERLARVTAVQAEAVSRELLAVVVYDNHAELLEEKTVRATADDAMAQRISTLEASTGDGLTENVVRSWIQDEATVRANDDEAEAIARQELGATFETAVNDTNARIDSEQTARADADSALAQTQVELSASLAAAVGNISGLATAYDELSTVVSEQGGVLTAQASQVSTLTAQASSSGNLIQNSELLDLTGWGLATNITTPASLFAGHNNDWHPTPGGFTIVQDNSVTPSDGDVTKYVAVVQLDMMAVRGGGRYQYAILAGAHRAAGSVYVQWFTKADALIGATPFVPSTEIASGEKSGGTAVDDFKRIGAFVNAPSNAAKGRLCVRKYNTIAPNANSYLFCDQPFFAEARVGQTVIDPYSRGVPVKNLTASITETRTVAVNTKGEVDAMWRMEVAAGGKVVGMRLGATGGVTAVDFTTDWFRISLPSGFGTKQVFTVGNIAGVPQVAINGGLMIDGSLTIRDAAGNIILHSGGSVTSQIPPYEWGATAGATIGSNLFGQFNGSNIGTYMANAAIGYLQLMGGAVSVSNGAAFSLANTATLTLIASASIQIPANGYIFVIGGASGGAGAGFDGASAHRSRHLYWVYIKKNGTVIQSMIVGVDYANAAYFGSSGGFGLATMPISFSKGAMVSAVISDVFTVEVYAQTTRSGAVSDANGGNLDGFVQIVGAYR